MKHIECADRDETNYTNKARKKKKKLSGKETKFPQTK